MENQVKKCEILSIDAWRDMDGGWYWNSWFKVGYVELSEVRAIVARHGKARLLKLLRDEYGLSIPAGYCEVVDDGYNYEIRLRGTQEPIYAVEYGIHF
jgi:hypothetical protein